MFLQRARWTWAEYLLPQNNQKNQAQRTTNPQPERSNEQPIFQNGGWTLNLANNSRDVDHPQIYLKEGNEHLPLREPMLHEMQPQQPNFNKKLPRNPQVRDRVRLVCQQTAYSPVVLCKCIAGRC